MYQTIIFIFGYTSQILFFLTYFIYNYNYKIQMRSQ